MEGKKIWQSKIFWLGVLEIACGVANYFATLEPGTSIAAIVAGILTIILRKVTNQPIS